MDAPRGARSRTAPSARTTSEAARAAKRRGRMTKKRRPKGALPTPPTKKTSTPTTSSPAALRWADPPRATPHATGILGVLAAHVRALARAVLANMRALDAELARVLGATL